jgi:hypothetical protein
VAALSVYAFAGDPLDLTAASNVPKSHRGWSFAQKRTPYSRVLTAGQMLRGCSAICASDRVQARPIRGHTSIAARSTKTHSGLGDCRLPESPPSGDRTGVKPPDGSRRQRRRMTAEPLLVPTRTIDGADGGPDSVRQPFRRRAAGADIQGGASARGENTHGCRIGESLSADTSTCYGPR